MQTVTINGEVRKELGKKATTRARKEGKIPCVLYGKDEVVHFSTEFKDVKSLIYTPDFKLAEVKLGGETYRCILKDVQFHPVNDEILHIDFLKLIAGHPVKVEVPVRFTGTSPGVKAGGKLIRQVRRIKIKTVPEKLVDEMVLDISSLEMGQSIRVRDIQGLEGVEIINSPSIPVALVEVPRAMRSATSAKEKEAAAATAAPVAEE